MDIKAHKREAYDRQLTRWLGISSCNLGTGPPASSLYWTVVFWAAVSATAMLTFLLDEKERR